MADPTPYRFAEFLQQGDPKALAEAVACLTEELYAAAGVDPAADPSSIEVACMGDVAKAGLLASAIRLRCILQMSPDGNRAMRKLGMMKPEAGMALGAVHAEVRVTLCDSSWLQVTAFRNGANPDSFICSDAALERNLGELVPELRNGAATAKPADRN